MTDDDAPTATDWDHIESEAEKFARKATGATVTVNRGESVVFLWDPDEATASATAHGMEKHGLEFFRHRPTDDGEMRIEWIPIEEGDR